MAKKKAKRKPTSLGGFPVGKWLRVTGHARLTDVKVNRDGTVDAKVLDRPNPKRAPKKKKARKATTPRKATRPRKTKKAKKAENTSVRKTKKFYKKVVGAAYDTRTGTDLRRRVQSHKIQGRVTKAARKAKAKNAKRPKKAKKAKKATRKGRAKKA